MKLYQALYNWMTHESSAETLSLHKTKEGAEKAIEKHKAKDKAEHDKQHAREYTEKEIAMMRECGFSESEIKENKENDRKDWPKSWQWWGIREIEVEE